MRTGWTVATVLTLFLLGLAGTAAAAPVTIDFESGAARRDQGHRPVRRRRRLPRGPGLPRSGDRRLRRGLHPADAHPGHRAGSRRRRAANTLLLDGCAHGEFYPTGAFFSLGYTAKSVEFNLAETGSFLSSDEIVITAFRADKTIASQELTSLPAQLTPVYKPMIVSSAAYDIAFVVVERGTPFTGTSITGVSPSIGQSVLLLDDLTYDPPAAPPESSFVIATTPTSLRLAAGTSTDVTVPITWVNNPNPAGSPVALELTAPPGVTATVTSPNPTTSSSATVHLVAAKDAPLGDASLKIDGFVDKGTLAQKSATTTLPVRIAAPFGVNQPPDLSRRILLDPRRRPCGVFTEPGFNDPVEVGVFAPPACGSRRSAASTPSTPSSAAFITRPATNGELLVPVTFVADRSRKPTPSAQYQLVVQVRRGSRRSRSSGRWTCARAPSRAS